MQNILFYEIGFENIEKSPFAVNNIKLVLGELRVPSAKTLIIPLMFTIPNTSITWE